MDAHKIEIGQVYWIDYGQKCFRVKVLESSGLIPDWWTCEQVDSGATRVLPSTAFVGVEARQTDEV